MHSFARNALKLSLAGAGVAVLGAGFVGQASAAEAPTAPVTPTAAVPSTDLLNSSVPDTSGVGSQLTGAVPSTSDNTFSLGGRNLTSATPTAKTATTPSSDSLPSLADTKAFQVPSVTDIEAPGLS